MYNETEFERLHQCLLCPREYYLAYCLLDGWYENELVYSGRKGIIRRLLIEFLFSLPIILLFVLILIWHSFPPNGLLEMAMTDYVIVLLGILSSGCLHTIVWGYVKRYLKKVLSYCSRKQTKREFVLVTIGFCKIQKDEVAFLGITLSMLLSLVISLLSLAVLSLKGVTPQEEAIIKEWASVSFCSIFFSTLITVTYSQYRFFSRLSAGLEMILALKQYGVDDICEDEMTE